MDGKKLSEEILAALESKIQAFALKPKLSILIAGDDYSSHMYVRMKRKVAERIGIEVELIEYRAEVTERRLFKDIAKLNGESSVTGIMIQLPLPAHLSQNKILNEINYRKDVDGLTAYNLGLIYQGDPNLISATPLGIIRLLEKYCVEVKGKEITIIGTNPFVGLPLAGLLNSKKATVTMCHRGTSDIKSHALKADILISATGKANIVKEDWVKEGAVIIDVGIEKDPETGELTGDIDFDKVKDKVSLITPVPGGVGPMTVACLMENVVKAFENY